MGMCIIARHALISVSQISRLRNLYRIGAYVQARAVLSHVSPLPTSHIEQVLTVITYRPSLYRALKTPYPTSDEI
jgi:hypothetical protein